MNEKDFGVAINSYGCWNFEKDALKAIVKTSGLSMSQIVRYCIAKGLLVLYPLTTQEMVCEVLRYEAEREQGQIELTRLKEKKIKKDL